MPKKTTREDRFFEFFILFCEYFFPVSVCAMGAWSGMQPIIPLNRTPAKIPIVISQNTKKCR
ncbi:MAG: hypothetical protein M0Q91_00960 [Methanoregula sp.]|nr:hypothetical protein [Methanoregula sp.]